uniref:Uncharacterized protein n=1 Tax=Arundo donax TaxID=35708 RepID=A0A0A8YZ28_ARUDO
MCSLLPSHVHVQAYQAPQLLSIPQNIIMHLVKQIQTSYIHYNMNSQPWLVYY